MFCWETLGPGIDKVVTLISSTNLNIIEQLHLCQDYVLCQTINTVQDRLQEQKAQSPASTDQIPIKLSWNVKEQRHVPFHY